jgi:hypothetical protein
MTILERTRSRAKQAPSIREARAASARVTNDALQVRLADGREIGAPLTWFPRLLAATPAQRANYELIGGGIGMHWPDIDEDLSVAGLLGREERRL